MKTEELQKERKYDIGDKIFTIDFDWRESHRCPCCNHEIAWEVNYQVYEVTIVGIVPHTNYDDEPDWLYHHTGTKGYFEHDFDSSLYSTKVLADIKAEEEINKMKKKVEECHFQMRKQIQKYIEENKK